MDFISIYITPIFLFSVKFVSSLSSSNKNMFFTEMSGGDIADYIASKKYIPNDEELPKAHLVKHIENDATYLLSKLSDEELLNLLSSQPQRNEFDLNDIFNIAFNIRSVQDNKSQPQKEQTQIENKLNGFSESFTGNKRFRVISPDKERPSGYFKLNHKPIDSFKEQNDASYMALQKLKNLVSVYLHSKTKDSTEGSDEKKELLFDILVSQLKSLCCKTNKKPQHDKGTFSNNNVPSLVNYNGFMNHNHRSKSLDTKSNEYMFLIINDEIKTNDSNELISVDPESLDGNSSVLLLGPVTSVLTDDQLKTVMNRISNELMKPKYLSLLQQLSAGVINNKSIMKNFVFSHETRRYIKPHRCNHQSKLAKVYGGTKWVICTGYLNINTPSLYD